MRAIVIAAALFTTVANAQNFEAAGEASNLQGMSVIQLREENCGGKETKGSQDVKNLKFVECEMFILGVTEMLREWQKIDPAHGPRICVPRNITAGALIIVVHDYLEKTTPWRNQQNDATTSIVGALKSKWPCG